MADDVEQLFMRLLAICSLSFLRQPFKYFALYCWVYPLFTTELYKVRLQAFGQIRIACIFSHSVASLLVFLNLSTSKFFIKSNLSVFFFNG